MTRPEYTEAFRRARKALRRGKCPSEEDIEHIYQQGWETEKELLEQCRKEYYDDDSSNQY
ncbi:hypothetical protein [Cylindrospermopsis raciborskii]|jgi:hypothetical protein|uniref:hypothetical protein n=1 Tax=Cylindrospermopsis raciborskii TaxID=77022 RepID=UPI001F3F5D47|nr:hypothetical protein [Cylindrospermopsis raciborskii]UJS04465.1 hypothetical protein L3I90_15540 [Cylindrospermopsis raciborskii KLL07]